MLSYTKPKATLQQVLLNNADTVNGLRNAHVKKVLGRLRVCRTAALGYHLYGCDKEGCDGIKYQYHSCRDRHCPNCGALKKEEWLEARTQELLPVKYYHVVFTLPHELNALVMGHRALLYKLLFEASCQTLLSFAKDEKYLGAVPGIISVLHTWGQQLSFHPHLHCIVSGGGITKEGQWKEADKSKYGFLFPVKAMSLVYKTKFLQALQTMMSSRAVKTQEAGNGKALIDLLYRKDWVVYSKAPFGGPHPVIEYLGRYTHKVAISNHRISSIDEQAGSITFRYKDYRDGKEKEMALSGEEFLRRFAQHILPKGFTRIRSYGYLANRGRQGRINEVLKGLKLPLHGPKVKVPAAVRLRERYGIEMNRCPCCGEPTLKLVGICYGVRRGADDG